MWFVLVLAFYKPHHQLHAIITRSEPIKRATVFPCFPRVPHLSDTHWFKERSTKTHLFKKTHAIRKYVQVECKLPPGREREREKDNVWMSMTTTPGWMAASCTTSASVVWVFFFFTLWLSRHVAAGSPSASSFLLRWVSPIVCCYADTNKRINQESLKVTDQRVSELRETWMKKPSWKGDARLVDW